MHNFFLRCSRSLETSQNYDKRKRSCVGDLKRRRRRNCVPSATSQLPYSCFCTVSSAAVRFGSVVDFCLLLLPFLLLMLSSASLEYDDGDVLYTAAAATTYLYSTVNPSYLSVAHCRLATEIIGGTGFSLFLSFSFSLLFSTRTLPSFSVNVVKWWWWWWWQQSTVMYRHYTAKTAVHVH